MKQKCTPKERVLNAFAFKESDRVPIDLGSTANTSICKDAYENLKRHLKIDLPTKLMSKNLSTAIVDDVVLERLNVDTRGVFLCGPDKVRAVELAPNKYIDEWGVTYFKPDAYPYYDAVAHPLAGDISSKTIKEFTLPDPHDKGRIRDIKARTKFLREHTDYAVVLHVMGGFITASQYLRGLQNWLEDLAGEPELLGELLDRTMQYQLDLAMDMLGECHSDVDIIHFGDDLGTQNTLMFSPASYREVIKPRQAKLFKEVKKHTKAKILFHTCGNNYDILDDLIEIGVDALNPVQTNSKNMQADKLKREFGGRLVFWGAIDSHNLSASGTLEDEVKSVIRTLAPGGGFVLNVIHNIQPNVSVENILGIFDAALKYGKY